MNNVKCMYYCEQYEWQHVSKWQVASNSKRGDSRRTLLEMKWKGRCSPIKRQHACLAVADKKKLIAYHRSLASVRRVCQARRDSAKYCASIRFCMCM